MHDLLSLSFSCSLLLFIVFDFDDLFISQTLSLPLMIVKQEFICPSLFFIPVKIIPLSLLHLLCLIIDNIIADSNLCFSFYSNSSIPSKRLIDCVS